MPKPSIVVENVSKVYRIGHRERRADTLVGSVVGALAAPVRNFRNLYRLGTAGRDGDAADTIRAVDDVSFEVPQGEVLGVIGRNGAGKSTLLKILSRVTRPTSGRIRMRGRVSSLLEVGTGFHPELTGRENVYLNGTILGMTKREIDRKFDEIVEFSGVEKFLETPVKRYSSGMKVRLAFAVAAHLEPEILLIDEVLAVGDAAFQEKCIGKMGSVAQEGRTVLLVSHNTAAITRLCTRCCLIEGGRLAVDGTPGEAVRAYLAGPPAAPATRPSGLAVAGPVDVEAVEVRQGDAGRLAVIDNGRPFEVAIRFALADGVKDLLLGFDLVAIDGGVVFRSYDLEAFGLGHRGPGRYESICRIPERLLQPGDYYIKLLVGLHRIRWLSRDDVAIRLSVGGPRPWDVAYPGALLPLGAWTGGNT